MECKISSREFFVVQYPGIVKNEERAIETLGGMQSLNKVFSGLLTIVHKFCFFFRCLFVVLLCHCILIFEHVGHVLFAI